MTVYWCLHTHTKFSTQGSTCLTGHIAVDLVFVVKCKYILYAFRQWYYQSASYFFFILAEYYFLYFGYKYHLRCWYLVITWQNVAIGMRPLSDSMQRVLSVFHSLLYQTFKSLSASCGPAAVIKLGRPACLSASSLQLLLIKISSSSPSLCPALQEQLTPWHHHSLLVLPQTCSFLSVTVKYLKRTKLLRAHTAFHRYHGLE